MDTLIAFLAAFLIIPAVFATMGAEGVGKGGGFAFASLATVFKNMPAAGPLFGVLFYLLLFFAAITSAMSLLEGQVAAVSEQKNWDRKKVTIGMAAAMFVIGVFYTLASSMNLKGVWFDFSNRIHFLGLDDFMENVTDRLLIPINALTACLLAGWAWGSKNGIEEVRQGGKFPFTLAGVWDISVKVIAPIAIIIIIIFGLFMGKAIS
jgi:NSS family neurotransmitter:Na+ symporter